MYVWIFWIRSLYKAGEEVRDGLSEYGSEINKFGHFNSRFWGGNDRGGDCWNEELYSIIPDERKIAMDVLVPDVFKLLVSIFMLPGRVSLKVIASSDNSIFEDSEVASYYKIGIALINWFVVISIATTKYGSGLFNAFGNLDILFDSSLKIKLESLKNGFQVFGSVATASVILAIYDTIIIMLGLFLFSLIFSILIYMLNELVSVILRKAFKTSSIVNYRPFSKSDQKKSNLKPFINIDKWGRVALWDKSIQHFLFIIMIMLSTIVSTNFVTHFLIR